MKNKKEQELKFVVLARISELYMNASEDNY